MKALLVFSALFTGFVRAACAQDDPSSHDASFSRDGLFKADVNTLTDTQLVVSPGMPLAPDKNVLWCGTLQLAWNEAGKLVGEKMRFDRSSPAADLLNNGKFTRHDLDPASYVAIADFERNHVEDEIRAALEKTFHGAASPELIPPVPVAPGPNDFVAYSYLYKNLAFDTPFLADAMTFHEKKVQDFGFGSDANAEQRRMETQIVDYLSSDDFIVQLRTKSPNDQLILAKITPQETLAKTIEFALHRIQKASPYAPDEADILSVPMLNFDLRRDFNELVGLICTPSAKAKIKGKLVFSQVKQLVRFQLNEKGAILKSEAVIVAMAGAAPGPEPMPHYLIFDKPFLILLKQKNSQQPYFALWVGNASLLVPEKK